MRPTPLTYAQADHVRATMRGYTMYLSRLDAALRARGHCVYRHPFARETRLAWLACIELHGMAIACGTHGWGPVGDTVSERFNVERDSRAGEGFVDGDGN